VKRTTFNSELKTKAGTEEKLKRLFFIFPYPTPRTTPPGGEE
jgi:hypothetical protein